MKRKWPCLIFLLALTASIACQNGTDVTAPSDDELVKKAKAIHDRALTLDTHVDIEVSFHHS